MATDTSEKGLETLIMRHMTGTGKLDVRGAAVRLPEGVEIAPITMDDEPCVCVAEAEAESCAEDEE